MNKSTTTTESKKILEFFGPARCDEFGNTEYSYVISGFYNEEEGVIIVTAPDECRLSWPTISEAHMARYDNGPARKLDNEEVMALLGGTKQKPTLLEECMWSETLSALIEEYSSRQGYTHECVPSATGQSHIFRTPAGSTFEVSDAFSWAKKGALIDAKEAIS